MFEWGMGNAAAGRRFLYFWRQNETRGGPAILEQKSGSVGKVRLTLVVASGGLGDGRGDRANVELLTSALRNVAGQKWATSFERLQGAKLVMDCVLAQKRGLRDKMDGAEQSCATRTPDGTSVWVDRLNRQGSSFDNFAHAADRSRRETKN
jgi:hypothetical protein